MTIKVTPDELKACWNANRGEMLEWVSLDVLDRRRHATDRLREYPDLQRWAAAITRAANSPFCTGKIENGDGKEPFIAGPDWLLKPGTLILIEEGQFDARRHDPLPDSERSPADLSYFDVEREMFRLEPEQRRRARVCGLAMRSWERERKQWYGAAKDVHENILGTDPLDALDKWALSGGEPPPLVRNYGPPADTPMKTLEEWMYLPYDAWNPNDPVVRLQAAKVEKKRILEDDVPF
jgi:hypothetical protein